MRRAGSPSWTFTHDLDTLPHIMLYVRDALNLELDPRPEVPGPLLEPPPPRPDLVTAEAQRQSLTEQWLTWWQLIPTEWFHPAGDVDFDVLGAFAMRHEAVHDPPGWVSLSESPELRTAVRTLDRAAHDYTQKIQMRWRPPSPEAFRIFEHKVFRRTVKDVCAATGASQGQLDGRAVVLAVDGSWWRLAGPGEILCSLAAARDPVVAHEALTAAFTSYVRRAGS